MEEIWKDIEGYEGLYKVSNLGKVLNLSNNKIIKLHDNGCGYLNVSLKGKTCYIHRLVAQAFIPNPENKPTVNHIDKNKNNNTVDNLEWATYSEQEQHKLNFDGYIQKGKSIKVIFNDSTIKEYPSVANCAKELGVSRDIIYDFVTKGKRGYKIDELNIKDIIIPTKNKYKDTGSTKKVICITTGKIYNSVEEASNDVNRATSGIIRCCRGQYKTCGKLEDGTQLVWQYYED